MKLKHYSYFVINSLEFPIILELIMLELSIKLLYYVLIISALKLSQVDIYTRRLRERTRRKRLMRDYQLVKVFFNNQRNKQKVLGKLAKEKK